MPNSCGRGAFGSPHIQMSLNEWVAAVLIRWLFIEDAGKGLQNDIYREKANAGNGFGGGGWDMFGVAMTIWVIREESRA